MCGTQRLLAGSGGRRGGEELNAAGLAPSLQENAPLANEVKDIFKGDLVVVLRARVCGWVGDHWLPGGQWTSGLGAGDGWMRRWQQRAARLLQRFSFPPRLEGVLQILLEEVSLVPRDLVRSTGGAWAASARGNRQARGESCVRGGLAMLTASYLRLCRASHPLRSSPC